MRWAAICAAAALTASPGSTAEPTLQDQASGLIARPPSAADLYRLKRTLGADRFKALADAVRQEVFPRPSNAKPDERVMAPACVVDPAGQRLVGLVQLAEATDDEAHWRARMDEADGALKAWAALREAAALRTEQALKASTPPPDAWHAELARRVGRDQFIRTTAPGFSPPGGWADGVSPPVHEYLRMLAGAEMCAVDRDNTAWLKVEIARRGWPRISSDGGVADRQAWLLVQHADHDPAWQTQVLRLLDELKDEGETNPKTYAYLFDRVAMKHGGPQRYGTQGHCTGAGAWRPFDDEPGDLDARRKSVGLPSEADYIAGFKTICFQADGL